VERESVGGLLGEEKRGDRRSDLGLLAEGKWGLNLRS